MKNFIQKTTISNGSCILLVLAVILQVASCSGNLKSPGNSYSEKGIKLCKKAIELNNDLINSENMQGYHEEIIKILNDPSPETYIMKAITETKPSTLQYLYLNNAFKSLEKAYGAYNLQLDAKISSGEVNLSEKLLLACNALDSVELDDALTARNINVKKNIGGGKYRIENTMFQITDMYSEVWNKISQKEISDQIKFQDDYENGIRSIPVGAFNTEKIKVIINEPYSNNAVLVNLYKLKLIKENREQLSKMYLRINNISESLSLLLQMQGELLKRKQDKLKIQELNSSMEILLNYQ